MATEKCLYAFDYVDLKDREYGKKHSKQRYLGDIEGKHMHRSRPSMATVVHSLVSLNLPETRAINTTTARCIISEQRKQIRKTYQRTQWKETLNTWSRPSTATEKRTETPVAVEERPHTSASVSIPNGSKQFQMNMQTLRPFSTGAIRRPSRKPPQASGFMWVRMKRNGSSSGHGQFKRITEEIRLQWEEEKKKERQGTHRKGKSQSPRSCDTSAGQWLRFAAGGVEGDWEEGDQAGRSTGVIEAFTDKGETKTEYYNVEGKVGADIATQLRIGNKIRIGVNGTVHTDSLRLHKLRKEVEKAESTASDDSFSSADSDLFKLTRRKSNLSQAVPLCWEDQFNRPDIKVMEVKDKVNPTAKWNVSERHPVVFEKLVKDGTRPKTGPKLETYRLSHRTKMKRNLDGTDSLSNRITVITVDQIHEDQDSLCSLDYEEILQRSLGARQSVDEEPPMLLPPPEDAKKTSERILESPVRLGREPKTKLSSPIVEKTPRSSPQQSLASDAGLVTRSVTPKSRSVHLTSPVPSSPSIVSGRPHTGSQQSERVQSSLGRGYTFNQSPTPRNVNSPYPNLAKPGQLPRSGVSSINPGAQEGEHEYIKISHPILPGSGRTQSQMENMASISRFGEQNVIGDFRDESLESLGQNPSEASFGSMDSMNVEEEEMGRNVHHLDDLTTPPSCSCSPETKKVVSAALSQVSLDSANFVNIPTADMNMSLSDLISVSDADPLAFYSPLQGSLCSDIGAADPMPEEDIGIDSFIHNHNESLPSDFNPTESQGHKRQKDLGYIINHVQGLELDQSKFKLPGQQQKTVSEKKPNRTVTFAEAIQIPFTPNCTPESTPRDSADLDGEGVNAETNDSHEVEQGPPNSESGLIRSEV